MPGKAELGIATVGLGLSEMEPKPLSLVGDEEVVDGVESGLELISGRETLPPPVGDDSGEEVRVEEELGVNSVVDLVLEPPSPVGDDSGGGGVEEGGGVNSVVPPPPLSKWVQDRSVQHAWAPSKRTQIKPGSQ
jgi:hypothetical protein